MSSALRRLRRSWGGAVVPLALLAACTAEPPAPPKHSEPVPGPSAENPAAGLEPWAAWFDELARLDQEDHYGDILCHRQGTQRLLWDDTVAQRLRDASVLRNPQACCGPLRTLVDLKSQLDQVGVELLVVFVPLAAAVYPEHFGNSAPLAAEATPPRLDYRLRAFYTALEEAGVEVLDLLPTYLDHRNSGPKDPTSGRRELLFRWQDPHWTAFGASVAASAIAQRVRLYPWFETTAAQQGEAKWSDVVSWVDRHGFTVERLMRRGLLPAATPKERVRRARVRIRGEKWSFTDRDSPIVLLGDSFAAPQHGLPDQLLKQLAFRVDDVSVSGGLPTGSLKALRFRGDRLAGKRLVIWEITAYSLTRDWQPVDILNP